MDQVGKPMKAFGVQFRIHDQLRFEQLCSLYEQIKHDKDGGEFRDPPEWLALVPDAIKSNFDWPSEQERAQWLAVRHSTPVAIPDPSQQLGARWDFYRVFEAFEEGDYVIVGCEQTGDSVGELQIDPRFGYPYGGVGPLIALVEAFGFEVLGVNESGRFEPRRELT